jgi:VanZ family protein
LADGAEDILIRWRECTSAGTSVHCMKVLPREQWVGQRFESHPFRQLPTTDRGDLEMLILWFFIAAVICYGSLYPFQLSGAYPPEGFVQHFLATATMRPSRGDVVANLVLYLPFGFVGARWLRQRWPRISGFLKVVGLGAALSLAIEIAQTHVTGRTSSVVDLVLNIVSTAAGVMLARFTMDGHARRGARAYVTDGFAGVLAISWVAYRLVPFVPTIDFQHVKDAIKPLMTMSNFEIMTFLRYGICWCVFAFAARRAMPNVRAWLLLPVTGLLAALAPLFITGRVMRLEEFAAIALASLVWLSVGATSRLRSVLAVLVAITVIYVELTPFNFSAINQEFSWLPFGGFITGSVEIGVFALLEKFFLYGSLIWLLVQMRLPARTATVVVALMLLALEALQIFIPGRSPEITDAILVVVAGWVCALLGRKVS